MTNGILSAPPSTAPAFIAVAISFSFVFFFAYTLVSFRHKFGGGLSAKLDSPIVQRLTAWIGVFGFMIGAWNLYYLYSINLNHMLYFSGLTSFLVVRMWFEKAIDDFNKSIVSQGKNAPELVAAAGNGFTSAFPVIGMQPLAPSNIFLPSQWSGSLTHSMPFLSLPRWQRSMSRQQRANIWRRTR